MNLLSLLGIALGITCFIVCAFKGINLFLSALLSSVVIMILSGMPVLDSISTIWMGAMANFLRGIMLIFIFSSLFGKTMADGKASRSLAVAFANLVKKSNPKNQKLLAMMFVPVMYGVLSIAGISGFVIVFTVLVMARDLFQEIDVPWRFYCYGGASSVVTLVLGGSLQLANIMLSEMLSTPLTSALVLSIIGFVVGYLTVVIMAKMDLAKAEKNGEGFMTTGAAFKNEAIGQNKDVKEDLPSVGLSIIPMLTVIIIAAVFNQVIIALSIGIILNVVLFRKYITKLNATVSEGVISGFAPVINVAATVAITAVISAAPGFTIVNDVFNQLPPLYGGIGLLAFISFLTASPTGALPTIGPGVFERMVASGVPNTVAHRFMATSVFTCVGPHSPGVVNTTALAKIDYKNAVVIYLKVSMIPGAVALLAMIICYNIGIAF